MALPAITITVDQYKGGGEVSPYPVEQFNKVCLAQGDSWFSIGAFPPPLTTNLLFSLKLGASCVIVNCASPGNVLSHMTDTTRSRHFLQLLNGTHAMVFDAILLSGGGNDLIDAAQSTDPSPNRRLLRTRAEWGPSVAGGMRYISDAGWSVFETHIDAVLGELIKARDKPASKNRNVPLIMHTYDRPSPRNCGAGMGCGPWMSRAMQAFEIPQDDWDAVAGELFTRLRDLLMAMAAKHPHVHLVDTQGTLVPSGNTETGPTADWQNEIHPTRAGYRQLSQKWATVLDTVL
ncbi:MAG: hypothetical protein V4669_06975 [Pseudomonadota bacterium]